jgi:hypothetical protein
MDALTIGSEYLIPLGSFHLLAIRLWVIDQFLFLFSRHRDSGACHAWLSRGGCGDLVDKTDVADEIIRQECGVGKLWSL